MTFSEDGTIGFAFLVEPGVKFAWGNPVPIEIGINLVSAFVICYLSAAPRTVE